MIQPPVSYEKDFNPLKNDGLCITKRSNYTTSQQSNLSKHCVIYAAFQEDSQLSNKKNTIFNTTAPLTAHY